MPAQHFIDNDAKTIITTWKGEANDLNFLDTLERYQKDIQSNPDYLTYNEIVNLGDATELNFTIPGLLKIGRIASRTDRSEAQRKLAIVVNSDKAFRFAKLYETYRGFVKSSNKEVNVFRTQHDAMNWISIGNK